jgi:hypothetical protein
MLQYKHTGISYQENSTRINTTKASFASLPGELRNLIYASTLKQKAQIAMNYDAATQRFHTSRVERLDNRSPLGALALFSDLDHNIRTEARSYFFAKNDFQIETKQTLTMDPDYVEVYIAFLENIGEVGRRNLRWLRLTVSGDSKQQKPSPYKASKLWELIADCFNLVTLDIYAEIDYFYMDQQQALKSYLSFSGRPISHPWPAVLESTQSLTNLKSLILRPVFSSRWRHIDTMIDQYRRRESISKPGDDIKHVCFKVRRPIYEAMCLADQIKGFVRKGLRGVVGVRVLTTETWDTYGANVTFKKWYWKREEWSFVDALRCKPQERTFQYSNSLRGWH